MGVASWITSLVVVATPGTGALFTIAAGIARGRRASVVAARGCTLGIVPHLVAAITGAAALLHASGLAFQALEVGGAGQPAQPEAGCSARASSPGCGRPSPCPSWPWASGWPPPSAEGQGARPDVVVRPYR